MVSENNVFTHLHESVYKRYKKTVPHIVTGYRPDPENVRNTLSFVLETPEKNFDFDTKRVTFDPDEEVLEIYSAAEDVIFRKQNKALFEGGLLVEHTDVVSISVVSQNEITDAEIEKIARMKNLPQFKKVVGGYNDVVRRRILDKVKSFNRPMSFVECLTDD
jgi:beta-mannanase